jgi:predicted DNA binding CopG/RHH family protein
MDFKRVSDSELLFMLGETMGYLFKSKFANIKELWERDIAEIKEEMAKRGIEYQKPRYACHARK